MRLVEYNKEQEKTMLCLPGMMMNGSCFEPLVREMSDFHFVCLTLDGFHPDSPDYESLEDEVEKITNLLVENDLTSFDVCLGASLGTLVGTHLAKRPELNIKKLWLDGGVVLYESKIQKIEWWCIYYLFGKMAKESHQGDGTMKFMGAKVAGEWARNTLEPRQSLTETSLRNLADTLVYEHIPEGLTQPIYLTFGSKENNHMANIKAVQALYPDTKVSVEKGYNHLEYMSRKTKQYAMRLRKWVSE